MMPVVLSLAVIASSLLTQGVETVGGAPFSLDAAIAQGPAVIVFWNSWLPEAMATVPVIREVESAAKDHGWPGAVVIFQDESAAARTALSGIGPGLPLVLDRRGALLRRFKVTRAPAILVVDRDGKVLSRAGLDADQARAAIALLAGRPPTSQ